MNVLLKRHLNLDDEQIHEFLEKRGFYTGVDPLARVGNIKQLQIKNLNCKDISDPLFSANRFGKVRKREDCNPFDVGCFGCATEIDGWRRAAAKTYH